MGRATGLESSDLIPLRRAPRGVPADGVLATVVVGGFVDRDLMLVRAWHGCARSMWVSTLRFDGDMLRHSRFQHAVDAEADRAGGAGDYE